MFFLLADPVAMFSPLVSPVRNDISLNIFPYRSVISSPFSLPLLSTFILFWLLFSRRKVFLLIQFSRAKLFLLFDITTYFVCKHISPVCLTPLITTVCVARETISIKILWSRKRIFFITKYSFLLFFSESWLLPKAIYFLCASVSSFRVSIQNIPILDAVTFANNFLFCKTLVVFKYVFPSKKTFLLYSVIQHYVAFSGHN